MIKYKEIICLHFVRCDKTLPFSVYIGRGTGIRTLTIIILSDLPTTNWAMPPQIYTEVVMKRNYTSWTKEKLESIVNSSFSYAECLRKMGLKPVGSNYKNLQKNITKFGLTTHHMTHQAHNAGKEFVAFENLKRTADIKRRLLHQFGHQCQNCGLTNWLDKPIPLELEHIDGNNRNNDRSNLTLLCCNCHALTPTWRNRKR